MMNISPKELFEKLALPRKAKIGLCSHTDDVTSSDIFIANGSGVAYVQEALEKGAIAVIYQAGNGELPDGVSLSSPVYRVEDLDEFISQMLVLVYADDIANVDLIGITGTNGKTSCAHFACQIFNHLDDKVGYIGTLGYGVVGDGLRASRNTTPDRITLYRYISFLSRAGCKRIIMEVSSHAIALGRIQGLEFSIGVFTNLSRDHLDFHQTMEAYENTKLAFFSDYKIRHLVVNTDDEVGRKLAGQWVRHADGLSGYGSTEKSAQNYYRYKYYVDASARRGYIEVCSQDSKFELNTDIVGQYNIENLTAAILICQAAGYPLDEIAAVTASVESVPGRLECVDAPHGIKACVDYAHTPAGMEAVLDDATLAPSDSSSIWCVFGCGGDRDSGKRPVMGKVALSHADHLVITDDNARNEPAEKILCGIMSGIDVKSGVTICRDRGKAIDHVVRAAEKNDLLLVLGKGDESVINYGANKIFHRDMDALMQGVVSR